MGCAMLCVYDSPTGQNASLEDVVVSSQCSGQRSCNDSRRTLASQVQCGNGLPREEQTESFSLK